MELGNLKKKNNENTAKLKWQIITSRQIEKRVLWNTREKEEEKLLEYLIWVSFLEIVKNIQLAWRPRVLRLVLETHTQIDK